MSSRLKKQGDVIALFALMLGAAGFFNTFDLSSGKIRSTVIHQFDACGPAQTQLCPTINTGANGVGSATILFDTAFSAIPTVSAWENAVPSQGTVQLTFYTFQAPGAAASIWTSMPGANAEIYSIVIANPCCRMRINTNSLVSCKFEVNVVAASSSATATLRLQYSSNQVTWTNSSYLVTVGTVGLRTTGFVAMPVTTENYWTIIGYNGNGVGDNPAFGGIFLVCSSSPGSVQVSVPTASVTATQFVISIYVFPNAATSVVVNWQAES